MKTMNQVTKRKPRTPEQKAAASQREIERRAKLGETAAETFPRMKEFDEASRTTDLDRGNQVANEAEDLRPNLDAMREMGFVGQLPTTSAPIALAVNPDGDIAPDSETIEALTSELGTNGDVFVTDCDTPPLRGQLLVLNVYQAVLGIPGAVRMTHDLTHDGNSYSCKAFPERDYIELIEEMGSTQRAFLGEEIGRLERQWGAMDGQYRNALKNAEIFTRRGQAATLSRDAPNKIQSRTHFQGVSEREMRDADAYAETANLAKAQLAEIEAQLVAARKKVEYRHRTWRFPLQLQEAGLTISIPLVGETPND